MNKKSDQGTQNCMPTEWKIIVEDKQHHRKDGHHELAEKAEHGRLENFVYWGIVEASLVVSHPTKFTVLSQRNGTLKLFEINKLPDDFEPRKTIISEDINCGVAAISNKTRVLLGRPLTTELSTKEEQIQSPGFTSSRRKSIVGTKQELMPEHAASQVMTGLTDGAEGGVLAMPGQTAGLRVDTVGLSIVPSTERRNESPPPAILPPGINCITPAMKSKRERAGITAIYNTLRPKGCINAMIEQFCAGLMSMVAKGELRITMHCSIGNGANGLSQNEGNTFLSISRITDIHTDLSSSSNVHVTNEPKVTAVSPKNLEDGTEANSLAANEEILWLESKDENVKNQPWYRYTRVTSDYTMIGNDTEILFPDESNTSWSENKASNVDARPSMMVSNLVFQAPQRMKYIILNNQLSKAYPNVLHATGGMAKPKHRDIINYCQDLRYSGKFTEHGRILDQYRRKVGQKDLDRLVSFNLEEAWGLFKNDNVTAAKKCLETTKGIALKAQNSSLLLGRIHVFMANIQLIQKNYKEALKMLDIGSYYLEYFASGDEKTFLCYMYGVALMMLAGECQCPNEGLEKKALHFFDLYLQHAKIREICAEFVRRGINCVMFKKAAMHLRTYNNVFRECRVSTQAIDMAKECLKVVEDVPSIAKEHGTKLTIMSIKSDIAYREEEFKRAKNIGKE
eukprot:Seg1516.7 transcript_id=Seg1516.7/GoldUCD/mRNA.D3Y31 product="hypothetical protein" protein_id=Seg1516.7/GoldUCD/D3Y31